LALYKPFTYLRYIADEDPHNIIEPPTGGGCLCSDPISTYYVFRTYDLISTWYYIDDTKAFGIRQGNTHSLKRGKTQCRRVLIMDTIAHVVRDVDVDHE